MCAVSLPILAQSSGARTADATFEKTVWVLTHLGTEAVPASDSVREARLQFDKTDLQVTGSGGCNRLSGRYLLSGNRLTLTPLAMTRMACVDGPNVEDRFVEALAQVVTFSIVGQELDLFDSGGKLLARFKAKP
jgi:heat shock protein HslJ